MAKDVYGSERVKYNHRYFANSEPPRKEGRRDSHRWDNDAYATFVNVRDLRDGTVSFLARALATVAVLTLCGVSSEAAMAGVSVNRLGDWDLERLDAGPLDLAIERARAERSVHFTLPRSARQGPDRWYLVRLHFEVELAADSGPGRAGCRWC
jgi:hypothetical protein